MPKLLRHEAVSLRTMVGNVRQPGGGFYTGACTHYYSVAAPIRRGCDLAMITARAALYVLSTETHTSHY